jgi:outer membrane protein
MKKSFVFGVLLFIATGVIVSSGFGQAKLGYVNSQDVIEKSAEGKRILARLQEEDKQSQAVLAKLDEDVRALQSKLNTQRITLTEEAIAGLQADLDRKSTERKRKAEDAMASFNDLRDRLFKKLQDELSALVEQIGKEKGCDFIFDLLRSGTVYSNPALDLTGELIKRYDASKAAGKPPVGTTK